MKRIITIALLGLACVTAHAADGKIAFIDGNKIIQKYEPEIDAKLQTEFKDRQEKLVALQKKLVEQSEKYQRDSAVMSEDEVKKLQSSFEADQKQFQQLSAEFNQKRSERGNQEIEKLLEDVKKSAEKVADKQGYDIVLQRGAAIYVKDKKADITDEVMKQLSYK